MRRGREECREEEPIRKAHYALLVSRFNREITERLLQGALEGLRQQGVEREWVEVFWVPGAFELPLVAKRLAASGAYDALICVGAVIRGETAHFEQVAQATASGLSRASLETGVPIIFSVLTTYTWEQAEARAGADEQNQGYQGAQTAVEMVRLMDRLSYTNPKK